MKAIRWTSISVPENNFTIETNLLQNDTYINLTFLCGKTKLYPWMFEGSTPQNENKRTFQFILFLLETLVGQENYVLFFDLRFNHFFCNRLLFYRRCQKTLYALDQQNDPSSVLPAGGQQ